MNILLLGDIFGQSGREVVSKNLPNIIKKKNIDFVIANGENAADSGLGIEKKDFDQITSAGVDVITSGNHIWDQPETMNFISSEKNLLRPYNLPEGSPGDGFNIFLKNNIKIAVINLMGNVFMKKCDNVFFAAKKIINKIKLKETADFIIIDMHAETTSEKEAIGHLFDGKATMVVGTHTHVPTLDYRVLEKGTAYQTDVGMCGNYNSVIGMNKENSVKKFLKEKETVRHYPAIGKGTISGALVSAENKTGLAKKIEPIIFGENLENKI